MVQALAAIPQLRQVLAAIDWTVDDPGGDLRKTEGSEVELLQQLFKLQDTEKVTYQVVDPALDLFRPAWTNPHTSTVYANLTGACCAGIRSSAMANPQANGCPNFSRCWVDWGAIGNS